jgi:membrane protease subunit HflK
MERNIKKIGLVNLVVLLLIGGASFALARTTDTLTGQAGMVFLALGFLVIAVGYFQMRLEDAERLEKLEFEELNKTAAAASLFNTTDSEVFPAQKSREQFERFFVPAFTAVLFLVQAGCTYWTWRWLNQMLTVPQLRQPTVSMSLFGLFALLLFLLGKYSVGLTRVEGARLLRPGANYLLLDAYVLFLVTGCIAAVELGFPKVDFFAARVLTGVLGLIALETLINLVLEIYRPRVKGRVSRVLYDSRLVGLLAEPEGLFTTAAQALDYQFGFKVSETWFYRFLEKAFVWLVLLQLAVLFFSTSFVFISPGEQGLLERFGRPIGAPQVLEPGLHFKFPWPIDRVYRYQTRAIQSFVVGHTASDDEAEEKAVLWTGKHYKEEANWLVASPEERTSSRTNSVPEERGIPADLININVPVQFQISDLRAWAYNHTDASNVLEKIATRELVRYLAKTDLLTVLSRGRFEAADELRRQIEAQADQQKLGVKIVYVGLQDMHPPVKVAPEFEKVVGMLQQMEAARQEALGYASRVVTEAKAEAIKQINDFQAYSNRVVAAASAQAGQFTNRMAAYHAAPSVYMERAYLEALEQGTTNADKFVITTTNREDLFQMNLEQRIRSDLIEGLEIPPAKK